MASVIRSLLKTNLLDNSDTSDSNTEEEEGECAGREQCTLMPAFIKLMFNFINLTFANVWLSNFLP